ncbi:MAG: roadblock/LC7 domain-containing protein [Deltaproteobacteria bacterium]
MADTRTTTQILQEMLEVPGIKAILIVGKDGFVIESAGTFGKTDLDSIGASVATVILGSDKMSDELKIQTFNSLTFEAPDAMIICLPVGESLLVLLAPDNKTLGMIRLQVKKIIPLLEKFF